MSQLGLFEDLPQTPAKAWKATLVRSHYRRTVGDATPEESRPETPMIHPETRAIRARSRQEPQSYPSPHNRTKTSKAASEGLDEGRKLTQAERCFQAILDSMGKRESGLTREQIASATGIEESTICARVRPMVTGADSRYPIVEPGITRIGAEGAHQKVLWVGTERQSAIECTCKDCGGKATSRMFEVLTGKNKENLQSSALITIRSCTISGCWWWEAS